MAAKKSTKKTTAPEVQLEQEVVVEEIKEDVKEAAPVVQDKDKKYTVQVTAARLNVRKKPSTDAPVVKILNKDQIIEVEDSSVEGWVFTNENRLTGFVKKEFVKMI